MASSTNISYRKDLQGLRALAIILVVFAHLDITLFEGGFIGVDVFFVLSGYLITGLLVKEFHSTQSINFIRFYTRRLKRLLPSLLFMIVATVIIATLLISPYELISKTKSAIFATTWVSNIYFSFSKIGYFSEIELQDFFLHTWSLSVEEQFYLAWPLFIFASLLLVKNYFKTSNSQTILVIILIFTFLISFSLSLYLSHTNSLWAFYLMPSRIWQFTLGGIVYVLFEVNRQKTTKYERIPTQYLGLLLIIFSGIILKPNMIYPGWWALIPSFGTALVLIKTQQSIKRILTNPLLTWIGDRSYAWYLWHWPTILIASTYNIGHTAIEKILLVILSLTIACISYSVIEIPFWKGRFSKAPTGRYFIASLLAVLISTISIHQILNKKLVSMEENTPDSLLAAPDDRPRIYSDGCDSYYHSDEINPCTYGPNQAKKTVVLIGDSILSQWFSLFTSTFKQPEWRVIVLTKSSCPMVDVDYYNKRIGKIYDVCSTWRNDIFETLEGIKPNIIITGSASTYSLSKEQWINGSKRIFTKLSKLTEKMIVVAGTPRLPFDGPSCLMRELHSNNDNNNYLKSDACLLNDIPQYVKLTKEYQLAAITNLENAYLLDLNSLVCPEDQCNAITKEGIIVYRDASHLTDTFVRSLAPQTTTILKTFGIRNIM